MHAVSRFLKPLKKTAAVLAATISLISAAQAATGPAEKTDLKFGFIKLTDMADLAVAYENGYFDDEGLTVELEAQANWKVVLDRVISGELDGSHMLLAQPVAANIGYGTQADLVFPFTMTQNTYAITVSNEIWKKMKKNVPVGADGKPVHPISASTLKPVVDEMKDAGKSIQMGVVFPVSTHNMGLRYWLAAGGINPGLYAPHKGDTTGQIDADILLSVTPPPQMPATMEAGTIQGYSVGEPWNQQAVFRGIGVPVMAVHNKIGDKVFGMKKEFLEKNPNTSIRVVKAMIRAAKWLDENNNANRSAGAKMISAAHYVGADYKVIANSMTGVFEYERKDVRPTPDFNVFFRYNASYPHVSDAVWYLTQMRRWGQIPEAKPDSWYMEMAKKSVAPEIYQQAAADLIEEGKMAASDFPDFKTFTGIRTPDETVWIDGVQFDATKPNDYLTKFPIGLKGDEKI
ncbi:MULTISPECIES: CmpA/NrtA family ABC transporter substrate-binding protein [unclassified Cellvibrio]|jgi:nitrate/nitrite transport system substrate-binding protein|uniref:CmpA/NrtA family ABC transporter substrate-binding protein n=1 Tax=unclassified Cellvibrio TaxID=2624793 RepID=UPI0002EDDDBE|nr:MULTISPECIES: CmpA/NrtA family ABC transporter substrate-binding protein [unclassified Cellvibrio]UUA72468.1 ABC transporter substrate-binding protein [Cellvibrio sp. QJXJ]